ncbi:MAG TPA: helix-turn-helix domain-containing protein [Bacteroidales bacterium]|nr:helix-turn-helix domain-containing protein [Bacteroidales bacterium]
MNQPEFGKELIRIRKSKGLTQSELADKCDVSYRTIQRIEAGIVTPRSFTIRTLSTALDYDLLKEYSIEPTANLKIEPDRFILRRWMITQTIDLFNLKKNTMKKLSVLTVITVFVAFGLFASSNMSIAQEKPTLINFLTIESMSNVSQKEAIKIIGHINTKATYHNKPLDLIRTYAQKSEHNYDSYVHIAKLVGSFGYLTQPVMEIANIVFMTPKECDLFNDIASLIFLNTGISPKTIVELAKKITQPFNNQIVLRWISKPSKNLINREKDSILINFNR